MLSDAAYLNGIARNFNQDSATQNWAAFGGAIATAVPEPSTLAVLMPPLLGMLAVRRRA